MLDTKVLLFVDDQQTKVLRLHILAQQRMGADNDIDRAIGKALLGVRQRLRPSKARGMGDTDRQPVETFRKRLVVLTGQQGCRHDDGHLHAIERRDKGRAQGHFGFAETDITAHQTVHWPPRCQIIEHGINGCRLILCLIIGKPRGKLVIKARWCRQFGCVAHLALRRDADQVARHVEQALAQFCLASLPGAATELVELGFGRVGAVSAQKVDVFDRQEEASVRSIMDFKTVMGGAHRFDGLQPDKASDAVIDMHHNVALAQRRDFRDEIRALAAFATPDHAVADNVLLGDNDNIAELKAVFDIEYRGG